MSYLVCVIYEDSAARGPVKEYGLHRLHCRLAMDLGGPEDIFRRTRPIPKNGNSKVKKACATKSRPGSRVIAVYDKDKVHACSGRALVDCLSTHKAALRNECPWADSLRVVFIDRNIETILKVAQQLDPTLVSASVWTKGIDRKNLNARDQILRAVSVERRRPLRQSLLLEVPSLAYSAESLLEAFEESLE